jgi:hypothetical protein
MGGAIPLRGEQCLLSTRASQTGKHYRCAERGHSNAERNPRKRFRHTCLLRVSLPAHQDGLVRSFSSFVLSTNSSSRLKIVPNQIIRKLRTRFNSVGGRSLRFELTRSQLVSGTGVPGATYAFRRRPLSRAPPIYRTHL